MYGAFREFQPPLGVTHAVRGRFGPTSAALATVFARKNAIDVYVVRANAQSARLELLASTPLTDAVVSLATVKRPAAPDVLCVAFDRMRVALLAWSPATRTWSTIQLLDVGSFLGDPGCAPESLTRGLNAKCEWMPLLRGLVGQDAMPLVRADPSGRCMAVLAPAYNLLYIVPFRLDDDATPDADKIVNPSSVYAIDLPTEFEAANVKDFTFLHGMFEPTVVILYESKRTWSGRTAIQRNTCALLTLSLELRSKRCSQSWALDQLPYDSSKLEAVPESARGGVMVISTNVIMQVRHGACVAGLSLNHHGDAYATELKAKYDTLAKSDTLVECDAAHCRFLDVEEVQPDQPLSAHQSIALLSLKGGELYFLHVAVDSRNVIAMKRAGSTVMASEVVPVNDRFFVLSSRLSDSLLVEYKRVEDDDDDEKGPLDAASRQDENASSKVEAGAGESVKGKRKNRKKRKRSADYEEEYEMIFGVKPPPDSSEEESEVEERTLNLQEDNEGTRGVYDDEDELGFVFNSDSSKQGAGNWALTVKDTLPCFGPGADIAVGPSPDDVTETRLDLVVAGGYAKNGCLAVVNQCVRPTMYTEFALPGCDGVWTLLDASVTRRARRQRERKNTAIAKRNEAKRFRNEKAREARKKYLQEAVEQLKEQRREVFKQQRPIANDSSLLQSSEDPVPLPDVPLDDDEKSEKEEAGLPEAKPEAGLKKGGSAIEAGISSSNNALKCPPAPKTSISGVAIPGSADADVKEAASSKMDIAKSVDSRSPKQIRELDASEQQTSEKSNVQLPTNTSVPKTVASPSAGDIAMSEKVDISEQPPSKRLKGADSEAPLASQLGASCVSEDVEIDKDDMVQLRRQAEESIPLEEEEALEAPLDDEDVFHSYMLLSTAEATTVLTTGADLEEVMPGVIDFLVGEKTLAAGNVLGTNAIVQVVDTKVRVIMNGRKQCEYVVQGEKPKIRKAQVSDPLVLLHLEDNRVIVLEVDAERFHEPLVALDAVDGIGGLGEDEFDEYGMSLSQNHLDEDSKVADSPKEKSTEQTEQTVLSYRNISLSPTFVSSERVAADSTISCAYLYTGPLASEIAAEGVLKVNKQETETTKDLGIQGLSSSEGDLKLEQLSKNGSKEEDLPATEEKEADDLDDEDRMLYGDDVGDEEEDKMLYGSEDGDKQDTDRSKENGVALKGPEENGGSGKDDGKGKKVASLHIPPEKGVIPLESPKSGDGHDHLLVVVTTAGGLYIFSCDLGFAVILECPFLYSAPDTIVDRSMDGALGSQFPEARIEYQLDNVILAEVPSSSHLLSFSTPFLIAVSRMGLPIIYRAFMSVKSSAERGCRSRLTMSKISFRDSTTRWLGRLMKKSFLSEHAQFTNDNKLPAIPFKNVCGRSGMFIGGPCPAFLFAERGYPRIHELSYENRTGTVVSSDELDATQGVSSFAEFHNMNCPHGFAYVGDDGVVRIGALPSSADVNYDTPTPFRKIALRCTPHKVAYHRGSATYGVLASMPTLTTREERLARILQSLEKHDKRHYQHTAAQAEAETGDEKADRVPPLFEELHELRVYRPDNWNLIKSHKLRKGEVGLAITNMKINVFKPRIAGNGIEIASCMKGDDGNESPFAASLKMRPKDVLVVGTGNLNGEDASSRGRLLVFEVSRQEVYTEAGGAYTSFQLQLIAEKELVSPVTSVAALEGYVIAGVGPLVSVYKLVGDEIVHLSFAFGQLYCSSIATLKQYVVAADVHKSVSFMYFRNRNNSVNFLARDYESVRSYATEFMLENENASFVLTDESGNVRLFNYAQASVAKSRGGKRLLLNGGVQIGSRVNRLLRVRTPDERERVVDGRAGRSAGRHVLLLGTLDGGLGAVASLSEGEFQVVERVWQEVVRECDGVGVGRCGGLSVKEASAFRQEGRTVEMVEQRMVDSRAVYDVFAMTTVGLRAVVRRAGVTMQQLIDVLLKMDGVLGRL